MWIKKLRLINFKNHEKVDMDFDKGWICITGPNGVGKTNILDAIWFMANSRSYFNSLDQNLILHESEGFSIKATIVEDGETDVYYRLESGKRKKLLVNDVPVRKLSEFHGTVPVVMISPFDISLILEGSTERRKFIDTALCKTYPKYLQLLNSYKKALESRNKQLKIFAKTGSRDLELLNAYNMILSDTAPKLFGFRKQFIEEISKIFNPLYQRLSGDKEIAEMQYSSHLQDRTMDEWLSMQLEKDLILERTTKGIHQDELLFSLSGFEVKKYGSQGQTKSFVISLQLALYEWLREKKGFAPILLLDDIYEKIDEQRADALMQIIDDFKPEQIFVTDTHKARVKKNIESLEMGSFFWEI